ncbi:MAG TPA: hypothetical protein PLA13_04425 [Microbacteriaceae bacterium]|jgi:hypothetical protein|nr:hypothetical protein [Microbacteriaceae bacterium]HQX35584.1 hypothetical protein [Microbacteriaceae bacterium]HQZ47677.1 hypothetical protein [Microbacteriaceae bacterium]HRA08869.1 hypothetical protein [Microbacteriaceae bacterium]
MRNYLFGTGIIGAVTSGMTLLRSLRDETFTWRTALAWLSWGISLALAIGAIVDVRRARHGEPLPYDTPLSEKEQRKLARSGAAARR